MAETVEQSIFDVKMGKLNCLRMVNPMLRSTTKFSSKVTCSDYNRKKTIVDSFPGVIWQIMANILEPNCTQRPKNCLSGQSGFDGLVNTWVLWKLKKGLAHRKSKSYVTVWSLHSIPKHAINRNKIRTSVGSNFRSVLAWFSSKTASYHKKNVTDVKSWDCLTGCANSLRCLRALIHTGEIIGRANHVVV